MPDELISGATDTQYVPTNPDDLGRYVYCRVRGDNALGFSTANSNVIGPIAVASDLVNTDPPEITIASGGDSLTSDTGTWTGSPTITHGYLWFQADDAAGTGAVSIPLATSATYAIDGGTITAPAAGPATTNLWTWLKADAGVYSDAGTTPATNGGTVQQWNDSHTGARHFAQATAGNRPTWVTNAINTTLPALRFDPTVVDTPATAQYLLGPSASALTAGEIFIVVKKAGADPGDGTKASLWDFEANGNSNVYPYSDGHIYDGWGSGSRYDSGDPTPSVNTWRLYNVVSTSSEWTSFIDGTQQFTTSPGNVAFGIPNLGRDTNTGKGFGGDVAELIMYSAKCSAPDKVQTKAYIAAKYGLTIA